MKAVFALALLAAVVALAAAAPKETYSTKYDNLDVDAILNNPRTLDAYFKCMVDQGPCTPEGREFRKNLPDALATDCSKCSDAQKNLIRKVSKHLIQHHPDKWEQVKKKFDPKGEHHDRFQKFLNAH
ncbi:hypothetical protein R5R35_005505 [Gryllus longicercus]|uniref:Chemosensory protein n=1 Tax=Gryllus longicercus TaxID=2509291 RepID=A0AAN9Z8E7_9ORTH